ncbi:hypothetical protein [Succiniclasticum ruminis]|jgi:hypothetical protein|uniref:Uncharacterized protein n=1 Tax=Succiniclasticum ruminis DSM 9236 TaxID=1123323 RepID=A0A1I1YFR1_9FIRM|nr:hypothetical protein [Succiniclasticum ruminis]SFE16943.1 hypothetical protein SAMN05216245_102129 [Succiniclasticum ruminis DSM 9236]
MNALRIEFDPNTSVFPEPLTDEFEGSIDAISCLHYAAIYEKWAERAKSSGRNDLATEYEAATAYWKSYYESWEPR